MKSSKRSAERIVMIAAAATLALAATDRSNLLATTWINPTGGDWGTASNWSEGVPTPTVGVQFWRQFTAAPFAVTLGGVNRTVTQINNVDADLTLQLDGATLSANHQIPFHVGRAVVGALGPATLNLLNGTLAITVAPDGFQSRIGIDGSGRGTVFVGPGATLVNNGTFDVGYSGHGTLLISSNTSTAIVNGDLRLGVLSTAATGTVGLSAGNMTVNGSAYVGGSDSGGFGTAVLNISGGSATITGTLRIWGRSAFTQNGGMVNVGTVLVGSAAGGIGSMMVHGGSFTATSLTRVQALGQLRSAASSIALGNLELLDGGDVLIDSAGSSRHVRAASIAIDTLDGSLMDLGDNTLRITGSTGYAEVASYIASARNDGIWNGSGLTSSSAAAANPKNRTLGVLTGAEYLVINGAGATFGGDAVGTADVLVKYTYYGDTDFNGVVDFDDYSRVDAGFNNGRTGWFNGDVDYNGIVDFDDYSLIDQAFNTQSGTLRPAMSYLDGSDRSDAGMNVPSLQLVMDHFGQFGQQYAAGFLASVPEPAALTLAVIGASPLARRRRVRGRSG